jgi:hypothetical protein
MAMTPEKLEYQRRWRKENPELYKEQKVRTRELRNLRINSDPDYFLEYMYQGLQRGARSRGYAFNLSKRQLKKLLTENTKCALSGRELVFKQYDPNKASIDRIDNCYGYSNKNVQVVSAQINRHRLDLSVNDFVQMCCEVAQYHGWQPPIDKSQES